MRKAAGPASIGKFLALVLLSSLAVGCSNETAPNETSLRETRPLPVERVQSTAHHNRRPTQDEEFESVARDSVPGFAGYYLDRDGRVNLQLASDKGRDKAMNHGRNMARRFSKTPKEPVIHRVRYDYIQLAAWERAFEPLFNSDGSQVVLDIDEVRNRIWIGYEGKNIVKQVVELATNNEFHPTGTWCNRRNFRWEGQP